jgi:hypothetical protein
LAVGKSIFIRNPVSLAVLVSSLGEGICYADKQWRYAGKKESMQVSEQNPQVQETFWQVRGF